MLTVSPSQISRIDVQRRIADERWAISHLNNYHSQWAQEQGPEQVSAFAGGVLSFAYDCRVYARSHHASLLALMLGNDNASQFSEWQKTLLKRQGFSESARFFQFLDTLEGAANHIQIDLDTNLHALLQSSDQT
jgi:hypothetical protein